MLLGSAVILSLPDARPRTDGDNLPSAIPAQAGAQVHGRNPPLACAGMPKEGGLVSKGTSADRLRASLHRRTKREPAALCTLQPAAAPAETGDDDGMPARTAIAGRRVPT